MVGPSAALARSTGSIVGTVTDSSDGSPLPDMTVAVHSQDFAHHREVFTGGDGTYRIDELPPGDYIVQIGDFRVPAEYGFEYYDNKPRQWEADLVTVEEDVEVTVDASLDEGALIQGDVVDPDGQPVDGAFMMAWQIAPDGSSVVNVLQRLSGTFAPGHYLLSGLAAGDYYVQAIPPDSTEFANRWFDEAPTYANATEVTLTSGGQLSDADFHLDFEGTVVGTVTDIRTGLPIGGICVGVVEGVSPVLFLADADRTASDGTYVVDHLAAGQHEIRFFDCVEGAYKPFIYEVTPEPGEEVRLDVALKPQGGQPDWAGPPDRDVRVPTVGDRLFLITHEALEHPADEPFHIRHGWRCGSDAATCRDPGTEVVVLLDGAELPLIRELIIDSENTRKDFIHNFRRGLSGIHTFVVEFWLEGELVGSTSTTVFFGVPLSPPASPPLSPPESPPMSPPLSQQLTSALGTVQGAAVFAIGLLLAFVALWRKSYEILTSEPPRGRHARGVGWNWLRLGHRLDLEGDSGRHLRSRH